MKLSVIIVNYNVRYFLELCLLSVQDASVELDSEIIVVDNNSSDDSCKMVIKKFPNVILLENKENYGFSKANNQGVEKAIGEYVLILNPDTVVAKDTFTKAIKFAKSRNNFGALGAKLIGGNGQFLSESKRGIPTPLVSMYKLTGITSRKTGKYYAGHLKENETGVVEILVGAFMLMTRNVYHEVNGFDESYFMYGEDIDLSYKILNKGYKNYYFANTEVIHYKGESTIRDAKRLSHFHKAMEIFYREHFKLNLFYDCVMNLGLNIWYLLKAVQKEKKIKPSIMPSSVIYFGKDAATYSNLKKMLGSKVKLLQFSDLEAIESLEKFAQSNNMQEIIFDNNTIEFDQIIKSISSLKNKGLSFKIHPRNTSYIIGSNTSKSKGAIFVFED
jgi:GT2 family glycosyltransferase